MLRSNTIEQILVGQAAIPVLEFKNSDLIFGYTFRKRGAPNLVLQVSELGALMPFKRS